MHDCTQLDLVHFKAEYMMLRGTSDGGRGGGTAGDGGRSAQNMHAALKFSNNNKKEKKRKPLRTHHGKDIHLGTPHPEPAGFWQELQFPRRLWST